MVAKSFQKMEMVGEPYVENGKAYVVVKNNNTGKTRTVRWYTESEYAKMYPGETIPELAAASAATPGLKTHKEALGFDKGYITIFKGDIETYHSWFLASNARYATFWGWYVVSTEEVPQLPAGIESVQLKWEDVGLENGNLKTESTIKAFIESLQYAATPSRFQGQVGDRLDITITVIKHFNLENNFGHTNMMIMKDDQENEYVWVTASQSWLPGTRKTIRGTVKAHNTYKNSQQTVLTRCVERK